LFTFPRDIEANLLISAFPFGRNAFKPFSFSRRKFTLEEKSRLSRKVGDDDEDEDEEGAPLQAGVHK